LPAGLENRDIIYAYPTRITTSFGLVARKHIEYLRKFYNVREVDEVVVPDIISQINNGIVVLHPATNILDRLTVYNVNAQQQGMMIMNALDYYRVMRAIQIHDKLKNLHMIGFETCDSDKMSKYAVDLINSVKKVAVPSTYCVDVFRNSGVKAKIYYIPHALDETWYELPNVWSSDLKARINNQQLLSLYEFKKRSGKKILLFWQWYSTTRKGWNEVVEVYKRIRKERDNVILVVKTGDPTLRELQDLRGIEFINVWGWLSDVEKMALYDIADATLLFSHAGAFELNGLESLARGVPCLAHDAGSWRDYMHPLFFIKHGEKVKVFDQNLFHAGYGYTVNIEDAVAKINDVLDNTSEHRAIAEEHRQKLKETFVWDKVGEMIVKMINE